VKIMSNCWFRILAIMAFLRNSILRVPGGPSDGAMQATMNEGADLYLAAKASSAAREGAFYSARPSTARRLIHSKTDGHVGARQPAKKQGAGERIPVC